MIGGRAWRTLAGFGALLLTAVYLVSWWTAPASPSFETHGATVGSGPRIVDIRPDRPTPGGTVVVRYTIPGPSELAQSRPLVLHVAGEAGRLAELWAAVEPISRSSNAAVFRLPSDLKPGIGNIRLEADGRASEVRVLRVAAPGSRKVLRSLLGGLGLVLLGLAVFSHAFRRATGSALSDRLAGLCSNGPRSVVAGASAGGLTQLSSFAATVALPAVERRLMAFSSAVAFVVGAHLGAVVVAAILPLAGTKDAPVLILLGVLLYAAARGRRGQAAAQFVVGIGVLLIGVQMLRAGFAPLAEEHTWALQLRNIDPGTLQGLVVAALLGAVASFVAQGPGPLLLIVVSLTQATNFLDIDQSLAILAGAPLGSGMGTLLVSWPFGTTSRRVALSHLTVSAVAVVVMWIVLPWTSPLVETLVGSDPMAVAYGKKILHPNATTHLAVACVLLQTLGTMASMALVRPMSAAMSRALPRAQRVANVPPLHDMLNKHERALRLMQQALSGKAGANTSAQGELEGARQVADAHLDRANLSQLPTLRSLLAIDTGLSQLLSVVERATDRGVTVAPDEDGNLQQLHQGIEAGLHEAQGLLAGTGKASLETLRAREIQLNAAEAAQRRGDNEATGTASRAQVERALVIAELAGAYEAVGNQLYRLMVALVDDEDF